MFLSCVVLSYCYLNWPFDKLLPRQWLPNHSLATVISHGRLVKFRISRLTLALNVKKKLSPNVIGVLRNRPISKLIYGSIFICWNKLSLNPLKVEEKLWLSCGKLLSSLSPGPLQSRQGMCYNSQPQPEATIPGHLLKDCPISPCIINYRLFSLPERDLGQQRSRGQKNATAPSWYPSPVSTWPR